MNTSQKPSQRQLLLGIALSVLAVALVFWKLNSASPGQSVTVNPGSAPATMGKPSSHPAFQVRGREDRPLSAEIPPVLQGPSEAASRALESAGRQVPPAPSETATAFQAGREKLIRDHQQLMLQLANATPEEQRQSMEKWHQAHAEELAAQQQLAIRMGAEVRPPQLHVPSAPNIPANANPELREFLTARHAILKGQTEMMNNLHDATPEERHQAMEEWHHQNSSRFEAMQTAATHLSASPTPPQLPTR